ncbi:L,D-transpeptidase [Pseudonocardia aurantiaca]|uniref:L,D-transpeptidase n=1 Tax=Pseudonocardia aurantiaca TaxID=75290 RepID=A0ABW4FT59_9PSEU
MVKVLGLLVVMAMASLLGVGVGVASAAPSAPVALPAAEPPPPPPLPATVPDTPCLATARACVELGSDQAWLISDGEVEYGPVPITHGRPGYLTPPGTFQVTFKSRDHVSTIYNSPMPYAVFFNEGIAFHHGSLESKSHGCIRLPRSAARTFFHSLDRGDVVQVVA